jgi:UDP-N-acetylmuramoyl-L-alanyl-D-glutamate--2,6-diaminopimelate ligase
MRLSELIAGLPEVRYLRPGDPEVTGLATDSRKVGPGDLFVAMGGDGIERHGFVPHAVSQGAVAVVVEQPVEVGPVPVVRVPSTRRALAVMSGRLSGAPWKALRTVGVTGTNGKTTTVYLIHAILNAAGWEPGLLSTVEYRLGSTEQSATNTTPEAPELHGMLGEMERAGCRSAVMEVSSHGLALDRVYGIRFDAAVFTNLTRDHLDFHGSEEQYLAAKATLFDNLDSDAHAIVNVDDEAAEPLLARCGAAVIHYGSSERAQVRILQGRTDWRGTHLSLQTTAGVLELDLALRGRFNIWNAAAATATGLALGLDGPCIADAVREVRVPGRFEGVDRGQDFGVIVDYAHTPDALANVLGAARDLTQGRLICVFGCGGDRDRGKRPEMGRIAASLADLAVVTSDNPRTEDPEAIIRDILPGVETESRIVEPDRRRAIERAICEAAAGDLVLIAGKGHETYQIVGRERRHFDDREVAGEVLNARATSR